MRGEKIGERVWVGEWVSLTGPRGGDALFMGPSRSTWRHGIAGDMRELRGSGFLLASCEKREAIPEFSCLRLFSYVYLLRWRLVSRVKHR